MKVILTVLILILSKINENLGSDTDGYFVTETDVHPKLFICTYVTLAITYAALIRSAVKLYDLPVSTMLLLYFTGLLHGLLGNYWKLLQDYIEVIYYMNPYTYLNGIIPILIFKIAFCIDVHTFLRAWLQIMLTSSIGMLLSASFTGLLAMALLNLEWNWTFGMAWLFGLTSVPIYPEEIVRRLKDIEKLKHSVILLEGETIIGTCFMMIICGILWSIEYGQMAFGFEIFQQFMVALIPSLAIGYIMGLVTCYLFTIFYNDKISMMSITLFVPLAVYCISRDFLHDSAITSVLIIGIMLSNERSSLTTEVEQFLVTNWELIAYLTEGTIFFTFGIMTFHIFSREAEVADYALIIVTYVVVMFARFLAYILLAPILSRIAYGLTFRDTVIAVWGGLKGTVTLCFTVMVYSSPVFENMRDDLVVHMIGLVSLTHLINVTSIPVLMKVLGLCDLSLARKTNMNTCVKRLLNRRQHMINMLKMDRFLVEANWPIVWEETLVKHPYKIKLKESDDEDDYYLGYRFTVCPQCKQEIADEPSPKEFAEMTKEARMRILKAKKISYTRQYETGMISKNSFRALTQAVETAMDTEEALIVVKGLIRIFNKKGVVHFIREHLHSVVVTHEVNVKPPSTYWRRKAYHIITSKAFNPFIYTVIVLNMIPIMTAYVLRKKRTSPPEWYEQVIFLCINSVFVFIYLMECILKIAGYSYIYIWQDGIKTYFSSWWNVFDFCVLILALLDWLFDFVTALPNAFDKREATISRITQIISLLRFCRIFRLVQMVCNTWYPKLIQVIDSSIDYRLAYAYDIGKGFVTGEEEVLDMLTMMIDNDNIRQEIKKRMEEDKAAIVKELGIVQRSRPWIAVTVKSRRAIMTILNSMSDIIYELKISGWVDDVEHSKLLESLNRQFKLARKIKKVQPSSPQVIFKQVPWMGNEEEIIEFLFGHARIKNFDPGEVVCYVGQMSEGILILVTGLLKLTYVPQSTTMQRLLDDGELPVIDYITSVRFDDKMTDYIVSGNSIGELSFLTGRCYSCTIEADSPSQAYILTHEVMKQATQLSNNPIHGLTARLWKFVSMRLASALLMTVPAYQSFKQEKIRYMLEKSFVPDLTRFKTFMLNEMMEILILIEGLVVDTNTSEYYSAPCCIPRTVKKLTLVRETSNMSDKTEPKLLIIPLQDSNEFEIMETGEEQSELISISSSSSKCLQHFVQHKLSKTSSKFKKAAAPKKKLGGPSIMSFPTTSSFQSHGSSTKKKPAAGISSLWKK